MTWDCYSWDLSATEGENSVAKYMSHKHNLDLVRHLGCIRFNLLILFQVWRLSTRLHQRLYILTTSVICHTLCARNLGAQPSQEYTDNPAPFAVLTWAPIHNLVGYFRVSPVIFY